jgi:hypothetical protein
MKEVHVPLQRKKPMPMSLPLTERDNPRDIATGAAISGKFHDVVVSLSKALHRQELEPDDLDALRWAKKMLNSAGKNRMIASMPSAKELSGQANPILILRRAAQPTPDENPDAVLVQLSESLDDALRGERNETLFESLASVRTIFLMVSQMSLGADVAKKSEQDPIQAWPRSTMTSDL